MVDITVDMHWVQRWHAKASDKDNPIYNYLFTFGGELNGRKKALMEVDLQGKSS